MSSSPPRSSPLGRAIFPAVAVATTSPSPGVSAAQLSRPALRAEQPHEATISPPPSAAGFSIPEAELPLRRRSRRSVQEQTAEQGLVRRAAQCRGLARPTLRENGSFSQHLQVGSTALRRQAQDLALRPAVCAGEDINLAHESLRLRCDLGPKKVRNIKKQSPFSSAIRAT